MFAKKPSLGVWVWNSDETVPFMELQKLGYHFVLVKAFDGDTLFNTSASVEQVRKLCHDHGLMFGIWGYTREPSDAQLAAALVSQYAAEFIVVDAETEYEDSHLPVSRMFAQAFRLHHPHIYAALSSFGRIDLHDIDWRAWADNSFAFWPQAYENESHELTPASCISQAERYWKRDQIQATLGTYTGALGKLTGAELRQSLDGLGVHGAALWEISSTTTDQLTEFAKVR